jgi:ATPase involved in DNA replication initiation
MYAYQASIAASKNPGSAYNPILLYGGSGLGKTHLMESIGNYIYNEKKGKIKLACLSAESLLNEFTNSLTTKTAQKFKNKYRSLDVFLLDDIHFLQGKDALQEEVFYIFDALHAKRGQMVFTCDRPISELQGIKDRLRTRFSNGLCIDMQPPNYETRKAILLKKMELIGKNISDDIIDFIAANIESNVRDLEGALKK